jgi:hypothetical protein
VCILGYTYYLMSMNICVSISHYWYLCSYALEAGLCGSRRTYGLTKTVLKKLSSPSSPSPSSPSVLAAVGTVSEERVAPNPYPLNPHPLTLTHIPNPHFNPYTLPSPIHLTLTLTLTHIPNPHFNPIPNPYTLSVLAAAASTVAEERVAISTSSTLTPNPNPHPNPYTLP